MARQDRSPLGRRETRAADAVGQHQTGGDDDVRIAHHVLLDGGEIVRVRKEIVVEEHDDVGFHRRVDHDVALARQPRFGRAARSFPDRLRPPPRRRRPRAPHTITLSARRFWRASSIRVSRRTDGSPDCRNTDRDVEMHAVFSPCESVRTVPRVRPVAAPSREAWHMSNSSNGISWTAIANMVRVLCVVLSR